MPQWLYLFRLKSALWTGQNLVSLATSLYKKVIFTKNWVTRSCRPSDDMGIALVDQQWIASLHAADPICIQENSIWGMDWGISGELLVSVPQTCLSLMFVIVQYWRNFISNKNVSLLFRDVGFIIILSVESQKGANTIQKMFHWGPEGRYHHSKMFHW